MDVTPLIPADRQIIDSYSRSGFRVSGVSYEGGVLVFPDGTQAWPPTTFADITPQSLKPVIDRGNVQILLLGCGLRMRPAPQALRQALRAAGIVVDTMDTGAACRTYNVLLAEDRQVAAALLPVG